jgi:glutamate-1-semialdehyde 2,1-aminomutase
MGCILPEPGFLAGLRALCDRYEALLVFDEVMTGFRVARGGAGPLYRIRADLTCFGKVIGGGLPAAAYGGRRELMVRIAPEGDVYQAGTLSGNPLAVAAGLETLRRLEQPGSYEQLGARSSQLVLGLQEIADEAGVEFCTTAVGGMFGFFFHAGPVRSYEDSKRSHDGRFRKFFAAMLEQGIYLAPSRFEAGFVSLAHRPIDIARTLEAAGVAMARAKRVP